MKLTRRQLLGSAAALTAAAAASRLGHQYLHRLPPVHIRRIGLPFGHELRNGQVSLAPQSEHRCHTLILGSGAAALSAAWYLAKHGHRNFLLAEGIERNGNNAAYVSGSLSAPSGAHYLALPSQESVYVRQLLSDLGILLDGIDRPEPLYRETDLVYAPAERLYYQNRWQDSLLPQKDADSRRFHALIETLRRARGRDGRKIFAIPIAHSSADEAWRRLDQTTFAAWLEQHGLHLTTLRNSPPNLTLALGGVGIRATELAALYRQLANCTYRPEKPAPLASQRACLQTSQILQTVGDSSGPLKYGAEPVALKTGTAYGWRDLWAIAYSRDYTILLWGGRADGGYNDQRASAEALIPIIRQITATLPDPPREYRAPQAAWDTRENTIAPPPAPALRITAPADHATIENRGQAITLQTDGGVPPYTWLANRQLLRQSHSPQTLWQPPGDGDYDLDVSDQRGNHAHIHIRLQTPPARPASTVRLQRAP